MKFVLYVVILSTGKRFCLLIVHLLETKGGAPTPWEKDFAGSM